MRLVARLARYWPWLAIALLAGVVASALYLHQQREQQRREFARELLLVREAGEPTTGDELLGYYRSLRAGPDATDAWQAAFAATMSVLPGQRLSLDALPPPPGEPWPKLAEVESYLGECASAFRAIEAAVATGGDCLFINNFNDFYAILLSHVDGARQVQLLLSYRAFVRAHHRDSEGAMDDVQGLFPLVETLRLEPVYMTQLVRRFMLCQNLEVVEKLITPGRFSEAQLAQLQDRLSQIDLHPAMEAATIGERVAGVQYLEAPTDVNAAPVPALVHQAWTGEDPPRFLVMMREFLDAARTPWPQPLVLTEKYQPMAVDDLMVAAPLGQGAWFSPSRMGGAMRHNLIVSTARETARLRAAIVAIAAVRCYQAEGGWPHSMEELVPKYLATVESDPFTGRPLLIKQTANRLVVYSVGIDGADDGGVEKPEVYSTGEVRRHGKPDVVFDVRSRR